MSSGKLRELRGRIRSVIAIQQTTRAMRMIAAVKLRKAQ
ncbi:MAG: F0F1 ATP synthase subunit gamma, partial [Bacteroidetes bacterium]